MESNGTDIDVTDPCITNSIIGYFPLSGIKMEQTLTVDVNMILKVEQDNSVDLVDALCHEKQTVKNSNDANVNLDTEMKLDHTCISKDTGNPTSNKKMVTRTGILPDTVMGLNTKVKRNVAKDCRKRSRQKQVEQTLSDTDVTLDLKVEQDVSVDPGNATPRSGSEFNSDTTDVESLDELYVTFKEKPNDDANQSKNDSDEDYYPSDQGELLYGSDENTYGGKRHKNAKDGDLSDGRGKIFGRISRKGRQKKNIRQKTEKKPRVIKVSDTKYKCSSCSEMFSTSEEVTQHIPNHFDIQCEDCSETFSSYSKMISHKKKMHKKYKCSFVDCEYEANKQAMVRRHINHDHKSYSCNYCTFTASRKSDIQAHSQVNHKGQPPQLTKVHLCHVCGAEFNSSHTYHQHVLRQHGIQMKKSHVKVCSICSEELMDSFSLRNHVYMMHTEKRVKCKFPSCDSCFKIKAQMESHYRVVHLGSLNLNCPYEGCSYSSRRHHIKKHINMVHLKIRSHPCTWPECGKIFYDKHHLAVHMLMHTGAKPLGCDICDYRCRQRAALKWHMKKKHPEQCQDTIDKKPSTAAIEWPEQNPPVGIPAVSRAHKPGRKGRR